ncbi:MAG: substrate-binding domain-containing protein, partial [Clostridiales bacterium]|nr:substrate-binding domain-containing protein [Clostridiales bacterium]
KDLKAESGRFMKKALISAFVTLIAICGFAYALAKNEYFLAFGAIDNIIGTLPISLALAGIGAVAAISWMKHEKRFLPVAVALALIIAGSALTLPRAMRGDWWLNIANSGETEVKPDLTVFAPFAGGQNARLDSEPLLKLHSDLPVLDGATALYPVYAAFAECVYDKSSYDSKTVMCTNTRGAYEAVIRGERDIIFVAGASEKQMEDAKSVGAELVFTPIGKEAFVFLVGKGNPIDGLTHQQIRNIYSGKTSKWGTLGWKEGGDIIAFQRPEGSGSQSGLQSVMQGLSVQAPQPLPDKSLIGTNSLMKQVSVSWKGVQPALGYSYRYYATKMFANDEAKLLKVDGVEPTLANIQNGTYPFLNYFYAVTNGKPDGNAELLIEWILSDQGQEIIEKTGYTPLGA